MGRSLFTSYGGAVIDSTIFCFCPERGFRKLPPVHEATDQPFANLHYDGKQEPTIRMKLLCHLCASEAGLGSTLRACQNVLQILDTLPPANVHSMPSAYVVAYLLAIPVGLASLLTIHKTLVGVTEFLFDGRNDFRSRVLLLCCGRTYLSLYVLPVTGIVLFDCRYFVQAD